MGSSGPMGLFAHNSAASGPREGGQKGRLLLFFPSFFAMMDWVCSTVQYYILCTVLHYLHSGIKCKMLLLLECCYSSLPFQKTYAELYDTNFVLIPIMKNQILIFVSIARQFF